MKRLGTVCAVVCLATSVYGQTNELPEDLKFCGQTEHRDRMYELFPDFEEQDKIDQEDFQQYYEQYLESWDQNRGGIQYIIPTVVHIVHLDGPENITDAQVYDAMRVINEDFNAMNADISSVVAGFTGVVGDADIEFRLATKDPNGNCHKGITRTLSGNTYDGGATFQGHPIVEDVRAQHGTWPQNKYMNVFVCIDPDGAAGYTLTPSTFLPQNDMYGGIIIRHDYFGAIGTSNYTTARAFTHEAGHWLNLPHTWGGSNNPGIGSNCSDDDGVTDTPNTIGWQTCNLSGTSCSSLDNVQNYMEYSYCSKMYTDGQVARMHAALNSSVAGRNNLHTTSNLNATGVLDTNLAICDVDFSASEIQVCVGEPIDFADYSYHNVSQWNWTFTGGTPSTSTDQNPTGVVYNSPGVYAVSLEASDGTNTVTETKTGYIRVLPLDAMPLPYVEGFENISALPSNETFIENLDNGVGWELETGTSYAGAKCISLQNGVSNIGNFDSFISTTMNLGLLADVTLSFEVAAAPRDNIDSDKLKVYVSNDCGETWSMRKNMSGQASLYTHNATSQSWVPDPGDWVHVDVTNITSSYLVNGFRYKFEFESDGGNNIYIDNINIDGPLGLAHIDEEEFDLAIYPNPTNDMATIAFDIPLERKVTVNITDMLGRVVGEIFQGSIVGQQTFEWDTNPVTPGVYTVNITVGDQRIAKKLIVE